MEYGSKIWFFPDGDMPPEGEDNLKGHESVIILNPNERDATVRITLYFEDKPPVEGISTVVSSKRVRCLRTGRPEDFGGVIIQKCTQYALKLESDTPVIAQYGRLDARQVNLAYYTTMGYTNSRF
jgi:hypothetical protein